MTYTVKRNGQVLFHTDDEKCRPDAKQEAQMQDSEHEIYVDGKKLKKVTTHDKQKH